MSFTLSNSITPEAKVQTKLKIGEPGDKFEQEADMMADKVMAMPKPPPPIQRKSEESDEEELRMKPLAQSITPIIQKKASTAGESELKMQPLKKEEKMLQAKLESPTFIQKHPEKTEEEVLQRQLLRKRFLKISICTQILIDGTQCLPMESILGM